MVKIKRVDAGPGAGLIVLHPDDPPEPALLPNPLLCNDFRALPPRSAPVPPHLRFQCQRARIAPRSGVADRICPAN